MIDELVPERTVPTRRDRRTRRAGPRLRRVAIAFVCVLVLLEVGLRVAWPTALRSDGFPSRDVKLKVAQIDRRTNRELPRPSVVLAGSSVAQRGLDPATVRQRLGGGSHSVYNAALRAATIEDTSTWLEDFVVPSLRPSKVVIGLSDFGLADAVCSLCFDRNVAAEARLGRAPEYADLANRISYVFRYRGTLRRPWAAYEVVRDFDRENIENLDDDGFAPWVDKQWSGRDLGAAPPTTFAAGTKTLDDLVGWLRHRGIEVTLVSMPVPKAIDSQRYAALVDSWRRVARRHGVDLVEPDPRTFPRSMFADPVHLNERGAQIVSAQVADAVARTR
jgi:hypothetical protein